jgi:DNA-binding NarL/FixJ family response regulator
VLLAAENPDLRLALELLLHEQPGVTVVGTASETKGLLALIEITSPDIVIMEWELPGPLPVGGMHQVLGLAHPPCFIVLGRNAKAKEDALAAGAAAFVLQGGSPDELIAVLRQAAQ